MSEQRQMSPQDAIVSIGQGVSSALRMLWPDRKTEFVVIAMVPADNGATALLYSSSAEDRRLAVDALLDVASALEACPEQDNRAHH